MGKRITIDPITRIEGHLRIEVEVAGGKVVNAWSSGQMFRKPSMRSSRAPLPSGNNCKWNVCNKAGRRLLMRLIRVL